ncbi:MMS19 nucleotide excision repair protein homolog isoform X2 [Pectinophora gossypiella]|uniref:MMS19 nucleotide excision repair protein homolog isoform X2 n=1 Tax=Pectinophora gossypiella TaxID=13191 RepID=UPI00214F0260|nr:MMS19 nucleotide excision repair protein homolog isoform X2 [Pectinophora gossypiella]
MIYMKNLGPDFVYGVISAMDGERDPRNLLFLFSFLPRFISQVPLGHLTEEMFDVVSCYYPIDFHPSPGDPAAVTRQDLANALAPCLCAIPAFGEQCLILLIEKLDSNLQVAKLDSLKLLTETCKTFGPECYGPFLKALWGSIRREISHKTDEALKMAAHEALSALVTKLSSTANTDQAFETFVEGILISMQSAIAEATTVIQFVHATKVLLTTANASKESCVIICGSMIPATIAFYSFKTSKKLQICSLDFLGELYDLAKHWEVLDRVQVQIKEIPQHCLTAVSETSKEYQIAGFKTLIKVIDVLETDLVVPFVEVLIHNVQYSHETDLLSTSVETVHHIAQKYPELIMSLVVKGKCDLGNLTADLNALRERLNLLSNLLSIDDFTKVIIEEMLKLIVENDKEAPKVIEALSETMSNTNLYSDKKVTQIESDHNLINSVVAWLFIEIESTSQEVLAHGYTLISNTMGSLPAAKQINILEQHTQIILDKCKMHEVYFLILESLYNSVHQSVYNDKFPDILALSLKLSLTCDNEMIRTKACALTAHFLNKADYGPNFELLYEYLKNYLSSCSGMDNAVCPRLIMLYGWIAKALVMRGSDMFMFWLQKITTVLLSPDYAKDAAESIKLVMSSQPSYFTTRHHCRLSLLYKQRMFVAFAGLAEKVGNVTAETKEHYLLSWAYVIGRAPKSVLNSEVNKIAPLVIDSLEYDNKDLLLVMLDVLCHFVQSAHVVVSDSLQTILPRLVNLSRYVKSMDVRIKSLQCLYDIANAYRTALLLPYKPDILVDLSPSLDDKKRLVRNMAVRARTRWFLIGAPGEAKPN